MIVDPAPFVSHSGVRLPFKVDCDAFTDADIAGLVQIAADGFGRRRITFGVVHAVPRGGLRLAHTMAPYITAGSRGVLIVDDVMITGASMEAARAGAVVARPARGGRRMSHDPRLDLTLRDMRMPSAAAAVPPHDERLRLRLSDMVLPTDAPQTPLWAWAVAP